MLQIATPSQLYREPADEIVARFIGDGAILPLEDVEPIGAGAARATLFGAPVQVRCAPVQRAAPAATLCLRPGDISLAAAGADGLAATVERVAYQGGKFRVAAQAAADGSTQLRFEVADAVRLTEGERVMLTIRDGWILPEPGGARR